MCSGPKLRKRVAQTIHDSYYPWPGTLHPPTPRDYELADQLLPILSDPGETWMEPWCEEHPGNVGEPGCMSCLGESHDAWMHRAKAAERLLDEVRGALATQETLDQPVQELLKQIGDHLGD